MYLTALPIPKCNLLKTKKKEEKRREEKRREEKKKRISFPINDKSWEAF